MKILLALPCAALLMLGACRSAPEPEPVRACTRIGCQDGVTVVVDDAPPVPYTVELTLPDGSRRSQRCDAAPGCDAGLFFEGVSAEQVTVRVTGGTGASSQVVRPDYAVLQPNGPDCPPTCRHARVQIRHAP